MVGVVASVACMIAMKLTNFPSTPAPYHRGCDVRGLGTRVSLHSFAKMQASFRARAFQPATLSRRTTVAVRAASAVAPVSVPVKAADGTEKGSQELAVKVASAATARGLVHRYLVMVQQNARRVRSSSGCVGHR